MIKRLIVSPDYEQYAGQVVDSIADGKLTTLSVTVPVDLWRAVKLHYTHRNLFNHIVNRVLAQIVWRLDELGVDVQSDASALALKKIVEEEMTPLATKPYARPH